MKRIYDNWFVKVTLGFAALTGARIVSTFLHMTTLDKLYKPRDFRRTSHIEVSDKVLDDLPGYCTNLLGMKMDPINLIFLGSEEGIENAFEKSGWHGAHPSTPFHIFYGFLTSIFKKSYKKGPFMPLFTGIGLQDISFQKTTKSNKYSERHHIRIWRTRHEVNGNRVWVGAATHEVGMKFILAPPFFVHRLDPNIDYERDYITNDILKSGGKSAGTFQLTEPISLSKAEKNPHGDKFYTSGIANIIEIP